MITKDPYCEKDEKRFLEYVRSLKSILSGKSPCQACHVLSVEHGSGKGRKCRLFCVPMTAREHLTQTNGGYTAAIDIHACKRILCDFRENYNLGIKSGLIWFKEQALIVRSDFLALNPDINITL